MTAQTHGAAVFMRAAVYLASPDQWDGFDILWNNETYILKEPFRSADCEGGYGQFRNWPKAERDALMARLVSVICKIRLSGFASIVPVVEYKKVFPHCKEHDPFLLSLRQVVMNMAAIADILKNQVTLWFERGSVNAAIAAIFESIAEFKSWPPARWLKGINFDTKALRPLQSADLVAGNTVQRRSKMPAPQPSRSVCQSIASYVVISSAAHS
jgi:hypothetical protein